MRQLSYIFTDVRFSPQIQFKAGAPTKAACGEDGHQGSRARIGFIDIGRMAAGQVALHSIAERAYVAYREANDTGIAQFASCVSGDVFGGHKCQSNTAG